jgi:DNA-binding IclR family transcriptional regulator
MLEAIIADGGQSSIAAIARSLSIPVATAHRQAATFEKEGYLRAGEDGRYAPGARLLRLLHQLDEKQIIANVAAPILRELAADIGCVVQLGTFENDMVTYRVKAGQGAPALFTAVGSQLEAYCSAIGKVLLAHLSDDERADYLASESFVALTPATITDPKKLAEQLQRAKEQGYATDDGEIAEDLFCIAVPIHAPGGTVPAALSISQFVSLGSRRSVGDAVPKMQEAARAISAAAFDC